MDRVRAHSSVLIAVAAGVVAFIVALVLGGLLPKELSAAYFSRYWFHGDVAGVVANLSGRDGDFPGASAHPAYTTLIAPFTLILVKVFGMSAWLAARIVTALGAGVAAALFFLVARRVSGRPLDALLATAAFVSTASFIFCAAAPETYVWGAASVLAVLAVLAMPSPRPALLTAASAASLGVTVTNWPAALIGAAASYPWRKAAAISAIAFAVVAVLAVAAVTLFAPQLLPFGGDSLHLSPGAVIRAVLAFLVASIVAPGVVEAQHGAGWPYVETFFSVQDPEWRALGPLGGLAVLAWLAALGLGSLLLLDRLRKAPFADPLSLTLAGALALQLCLYAVYGEETFRYSLHFVPLLLLVVLTGATTRWRPATLGLLAAVTVFGGVNNLQRFTTVAAAAREYAQTERSVVRAAEVDRPGDFWPRSAGHVPLGVPGLLEEDKAVIEPGGAFSPSVGSFGVSIWTLDAEGRPVSSSDSIALSETRSRYLDEAVGVAVETPDYVLAWRSSRPGTWTLELTPEQGVALDVVIRSVGPAGSPIRSLRSEGMELVLNDRWRLAAREGLEIRSIGIETAGGLSGADSSSTEPCVDDEGWCYAILRVAGPRAALEIVDGEAAAASVDPALARRGSGLTLDLPDPRLGEAIDASVTQILEGVVGRDLRPGEPTNYPISWQRDAAVTIVALVRAGRADAASVLVEPIAETDYFGGFGAETDAPGLAIWAIAEVSRALQDPAFDARMAPHVARKADEILVFMSATEDVRRDYQGPLVATVAHLDGNVAAHPSTDGLIHGRMDWHDPTLALTAISLHGLEEAAAFAERRGDAEDAARWRAAASELRDAWRGNADHADMSNERTFAIALWPSFVAADVPQFRAALEERWRASRDDAGGYLARPLWTYFELAAARSWLVLGEPDRAWQTLEYFWANTPHPGLYTLWESNREENNFGRWQAVRGWVHPREVTPHYWASAEEILLGVAMLAYVDRGAGEETLVIGEGVKSDWLDEDFGAEGLVTEWGLVDWRWQDGVMRVTAPPGPVRLGPAFPPDAEIVITAR